MAAVTATGPLPLAASGRARVQLLAIVEVAHDQRVRCLNPGCGHSVYKAIHVVRDGDDLLVLGSTCFGRRYGRAVLAAPRYGGGAGRLLTAEERELLITNTGALLERFEGELNAMKLATQAYAPPPRSAVKPPPATSPWIRDKVPGMGASKKQASPWPWMKPGTSMAGFRLSDGSCWVRVQRTDGQQMLLPWPSFDGWDEWLPSHFGAPDLVLGAYQVHDIQALVAYLRARSTREKISGSWGEIAAALA